MTAIGSTGCNQELFFENDSGSDETHEVWAEVGKGFLSSMDFETRQPSFRLSRISRNRTEIHNKPFQFAHHDRAHPETGGPSQSKLVYLFKNLFKASTF